MHIKSSYQKPYYTKLLNEIDDFLFSFKKRYDLFPWKSMNKSYGVKAIKTSRIKIFGRSYTVKELTQRVNKISSELKPALRRSYYNYILVGFIKESGKINANVKLIYNDYSNQLKVLFKDMRDNLTFCVEALAAINKKLREEIDADKNRKFNESEELYMIGKFITESGMRYDMRDIYLESYNTIVFEDVSDCDESLNKIKDDIVEKLKSFSSNRKDKKFDEAIKDLKDVNKNLISFKTQLRSCNLKSGENCSKDAKKFSKLVDVVMSAIIVAIPTTGKASNVISKLGETKKNLKKFKDLDCDEFINKCVDALDVYNDAILLVVADIKLEKNIDKKASKELDKNREFHEGVLEAYRACQRGEITLEQREEIIRELHDKKYLFEASCSIEISGENMTNKELYDATVKELYKRCASGEISVDQRELLIDKAKKMLDETNDDIKLVEPISDSKPEVSEDASSDSDGEKLEPKGIADEIDRTTADFADSLKNININSTQII